MTKKQKEEQEQAKEELRKILKPGDTVYCGLKHVSRSGMQREIALYVATAECGPRCVICGAEEWDLGGTCPDGEVHSVEKHAPKAGIRWITGYAATALGMRRGKRDGIVIGGCGMDMGFALVNSLSYALYGDGYKCLGKGAEPKCPSNYHVNHRDSVRCEGETIDGERKFCWAPSPWNGEAVPETWPRGKSKAGYRKGRLLHCVSVTEDVQRVCGTCKGEGYLPNPEGKEKWDLVHKDGYALKSEWL
jgi:hypothetical protein